MHNHWLDYDGDYGEQLVLAWMGRNAIMWWLLFAMSFVISGYKFWIAHDTAGFLITVAAIFSFVCSVHWGIRYHNLARDISHRHKRTHRDHHDHRSMR